jgi:type III secretion protein V
LPGIPFVVIAVGLFLAARARAAQLARDEQRAAAEPAPAAKTTAAGAPSFIPMVVPWSVEVGDGLHALLPDIGTSVVALRERLFAELGVPLPAPRVRAATGLAGRHVVVSLFEVPACVIPIADAVSDEEAVKLVEATAADLLRARAADFLGLAETQRLLDELEQFAPATVRNVVPKPVSLALLTDVLRRLLEERISIRDLRAILEALATLAGTEKDALTLTELVRAQLRRALTFKLTRGRPELGVVLVDPMIEDSVRRAITRTAAGAFLTLPPAAARDVVAARKRAAHEARGPDAAAVAPVFLTQPDIRRFVKKLLEAEIPEATVVSFAELLPEVALRPLARANLAGIG